MLLRSEKMNVIVIGLGSMGKRRIRLLKQIVDIEEIIGIDSSRERRSQVEVEFKIGTYDSIDHIECIEKYHIAFICTPPLTHYQVIDRCLDKKLHIFSEINLVADGYHQLMNKAEKNNRCLFLSSTMLYRKELQYVYEKIKDSKSNVNYTYHVGQYLPDWHPWESYKEFFVNEVRTNGCREIFAIELPWIVHTFGKIKKIKVEKDKLTNLDLAYNDNYMVILVHESGHKGLLHINVVSRKAMRKLEIVSEELYLTWEGTPQTLIEYNYEQKQDIFIDTYDHIDKDKKYSSNIIENAYLDEIKNFINTIKGLEQPRHSFSKDSEILKIIDKIEDIGEEV